MSRLNHNVGLLELAGDTKEKDRTDQTDVSRAASGPRLTFSPQLTLSTDYDPQTGTYQTNRFGACKNRLQINTDPPQQPRQPQTSQRLPATDSLGYYLRNALSLTTSTPSVGVNSTKTSTFRRLDHIISYLFYLNVIMSVLNTLLLSFLVKSLQLNGTLNTLSKEGPALAWDEHSESIILDWPVSLRGDKFLSIGTIESNQDRPLIIEHVNANSNVKAATHNVDQIQVNSNANKKGQILISAQAQRLMSDGRAPTEANYILLPHSNGLTHSFNEKVHSRQKRPVEIVTNSLILNQLNDGEHLMTQKDAPRNSESKSQGYNVHARTNAWNDRSKKRNMPTVVQTNSRRLLELDGHNQTIVLPLLSKIDLFPSSSKTLFVNDELRCNSAINGRLDANFDVQTRWGNLSFQSGRTLRIVSKSDKLDLASTRRLILEAPTLRFNVPKTNKVFVSTGIEFFEANTQKDESLEQSLAAEKGNGQLSGQHSDWSPSSPSLEAFKLVLVDDILMAESD